MKETIQDAIKELESTLEKIQYGNIDRNDIESSLSMTISELQESLNIEED